MSLSRSLIAVAFAVSPAVLGAQADPDRAVAGGGALPAGWNARTERNAPLDNVKFVTMGSGLHVTLGPATIFWRAQDVASGNYHLVATFTQTKAPEHPEAYGLFLGGRDLADSTQGYTYFLLRTVKDRSEFSIRRRAGYTTNRTTNPTTVKEWTAHEAIVAVDSSGRATNELSVLVKDGKVSFMINGKEVYIGNATDLDVSGIAGYRVNHNLDVHLSALGIHKM